MAAAPSQSTHPESTAHVIISLRMDDRIFVVMRTTLLSIPNTMFTALFGQSDDGVPPSAYVVLRDETHPLRPFIFDRNPRYFEPILNYMRTGEIIIDPGVNPEGVLAEAQFFNIQPIVERLHGAHETGRQSADLRVRIGYALEFEALGRLDEALKAYGEALTTEPGNTEIKESINRLQLQIKDRNEKSDASLICDADRAKALGNSLFSSGKYDQAARLYTRAIELTQEDTEEKANYYANRAACRQQAYDYNGVIADTTAALRINPKHVKALLRRAIAYEGGENWQLALNDYQQVNLLSPGTSNASHGTLRCQRALRG